MILFMSEENHQSTSLDLVEPKIDNDLKIENFKNVITQSLEHIKTVITNTLNFLDNEITESNKKYENWNFDSPPFPEDEIENVPIKSKFTTKGGSNKVTVIKKTTTRKSKK